MIRQVSLTHGKVAVVDAIDFRNVAKHKWHAFHGRGDRWYARTKISGRRVFLHNFLLGVKPVDHRDGDGLNNTRNNLRPATAVQNARNRRPNGTGTSRFKGVYLLRPGWFRSLIGYGGKQLSLGCFRSEADAARAYDAAAKRLHGEFASLNFPEAGHGGVAVCVAAGVCPVHQHGRTDRPGGRAAGG